VIPSDCVWPRSRAGEAVDALARTCFSRPGVGIPWVARSLDNGVALWDLDERLDAWAGVSGVEVEAFEGSFEELGRAVSGAAPAILALGDWQELLVLVGRGSRSVGLLTPSGEVVRVAVARIASALGERVERRFGREADAVLEHFGLDDEGYAEARSAILRELSRSERIRLGWLVRLPPGSSLWAQLRGAGAMGALAGFTGAHAAQYVAWVCSWWLIGRVALHGQFDPGLVAGWALLLAALVPLRLVVDWLQGRFSLVAGALLRRRLLNAALCQNPDEIRKEGKGQILGRVIESEALESLALTGGLVSVVAVVELLVSSGVLGLGVVPRLHLASLGFVLVAILGLTLRHYRQRVDWTDRRLDLTDHLVERMVGHRTLIAQQPPFRWHEGQDRALGQYLESSRSMDRTSVLLALIPRVWLLLGISGLVPVFVDGFGSWGRFAVSLGGVLLVYRALVGLAVGLAQLSSALISWRRIEGLFRAAKVDVPSPMEFLAAQETPGAASQEGMEPLLEARGIAYQYPGRVQPALRDCHLAIQAGDRLLLEGPSGGGKSTLVSLLTGRRLPAAGLILLDGLDCRSSSRRTWRRQAASTPQFHDNHVLAETFLFNLLMGRRWPPESGDIEEARQVCHELGLGPLLERMPGGLSQMVGEMGWRLSHGEASRLFIARALLQAPSLLVFDESFGALDPESLEQAMRCVERRADALLVVTHR